VPVLEIELLPDFGFESESIESVRKRYSGFGISLFKLIEDCHEEVYGCLAFYRSTTHQKNDVYAVCSCNNYSCAIQLDPDTEVICLWNKTVRTEITSWSENPEHEALEFLLENLACST
jgi:hypothetical protein